MWDIIFQMNIYKNKLISRFGLMHMIATNISIWCNVLILETYHEIAEIHHLGDHSISNITQSTEATTVGHLYKRGCKKLYNNI